MKMIPNLKRIVSVFVILLLTVSTVSAQSLNVLCNVTFDDKSELACILVKKDENSSCLSESDIIFYIKDNAEKCKADGIKKVTVDLDGGILNEDNLASIVEEIDVINVNASGKTHITNNAVINYLSNSADEVVNKNDINDADVKNDSPSQRLNNILYMTFTLLIIALLALFAAKYIKRKK